VRGKSVPDLNIKAIPGVGVVEKAPYFGSLLPAWMKSAQFAFFPGCNRPSAVHISDERFD
jgi:hypothetical protein